MVFYYDNFFDQTVGTEEITDGDNWKNIWKLMVHERIRSFIWIIYHNGLMTKQYLNNFNLKALIVKNVQNKRSQFYMFRGTSYVINIYGINLPPVMVLEKLETICP